MQNTLIFLALVVMAGDKNELPEAVVKAIRGEAKVEVFYLDGTIADAGKPSFHDYAIVNSVEVKAKKELVDTLVKDVAAGMGGPRAFKASHGIRFSGKDWKVDIVLGDSWAFVWFKDEGRKDLRLGNNSSILKVLDDLK